VATGGGDHGGDPDGRALRGEGPGESGGEEIPPLEASVRNPADHPIAPGRGLANLAVVLRVRCAWCGLVIREGSPGAPESSDCCSECEGRFRAANAHLIQAMAPLPQDLRVDPPSGSQGPKA
jgi:hypothetical protein